MVDIFHPSKFGGLADSSPCLGALNTACRLLFVFSFLLLRNVMFPYEALLRVLPDLLALMRSREDGLAYPIAGLAVATAFTALQLYWGYLLMKQLAKMAEHQISGRTSFSDARTVQL